MMTGRRRRRILIGLALAASVGAVPLGSAPADAAGLETVLVNRNNAGEKGTGGDSVRPSVSSQGQIVAFASRATNLVPGDTNGFRDIFVRYQSIGQTVRVSLSRSGVQPNSDSSLPSIDNSAQVVAYESSATNLVPGDTNGQRDVFARDISGGTTLRVSVASGGAEAVGGVSGDPEVSGNGRFVAFISRATNLVTGDTNAASDIFVRDLDAGVTTRVSRAGGGAQGNGDSFHPTISSDGRFVAFASRASNLVAGDTNNAEDVFVHDRSTGTTTRVSVTSGGVQGNGNSQQPSIFGNLGVAFQSVATNLVPGDTNAASDIFVRRIAAGPQNTTVRASVTSSGGQANGPSSAASLAYPYVAFVSQASNLVGGDTNNQADVFRRDVLGALTQRWSVASGGSQANRASSEPAIDRGTDAGHRITYVTSANLVPDDSALTDVYQTTDP